MKTAIHLVDTVNAWFHSVIDAGTAGVEDEEAVMRIRMVNKLSFTFGIMILIIAPIMLYFLKGSRSILIPISVEFLINASVIWLNHRRKYVTASLILYFLQCFAIVYFGFLLGRLLQLQFTIVFLLSVIYLIFKEAALRRIAFIAALVVLACLEASYYFHDTEPVLPISYNTAYVIHLMVVLGVLFIIVVVSKPYVRSKDINAALRRADNFKRVFVYQVIHEMRTPLNAIFGVAQLLRKEIRHDKSIGPLTEQLLSATNNARNIINNVLDMAQIESGQTETLRETTFLVRPFFSNLVAVNSVVAASREMQLELDVINMPAAMTADSLKLIQVATNLLANAIKYGEQKSIVRLIISGEQRNWKMQVVNSGPNISPEKLPVIFDPFITDKKGYTEGTGLGLYIVKNKVAAMQGRIEVESPPGGETVFTVTLPLREAQEADVPVVETHPEISDLGNIRVYIAEDNELNARLLKRLLENTGCEVQIAQNGQELLLQVKKSLPDIIILDYHMEIMDGRETLIHLKCDPELSGIPVIVATGDAFVESRDALIEAGANAFIEKPIDHRVLLELLQKYRHHNNSELQE